MGESNETEYLDREVTRFMSAWPQSIAFMSNKVWALYREEIAQMVSEFGNARTSNAITRAIRTMKTFPMIAELRELAPPEVDDPAQPASNLYSFPPGAGA